MKESDLHAYQKKGVEHIINNPYCGLFLDMGLGKTVTTLTAIEKLMYDYLEVESVLIVAPKRVVQTVWAEECSNWDHLNHLSVVKIVGSERQRIAAYMIKADIHIISRDNLTWLCAYCGSVLPYDMIVIDELSSFKSHKSQRFKAMRLIRSSAKRLVGLTGTPAPNGLIDLWPQVYLMDKGERLEKTITKYRERYFTPGQTKGHIVYNYRLNKESDEMIHEKIEDICISMKSEDYLDMPERTDNYIKLEMPEALRHQYLDFEKNKVLELVSGVGPDNEITVLNAAALSNKLLQFANGAVYDENGGVHAVHDIKLEALEEIIEDANGKSVLVAWTFRHDRDRIMEYLKKYKPRELKTEVDIKEWNEGKIQVLLAHPASAGHGLNLQFGGSMIVWYGQTYSLELYQQFNGRLFRQGQKLPVVINHLLLKGTHDEDVIKSLQSKDRVQDGLMNSIKAKIDKYIKR